MAQTWNWLWFDELQRVKLWNRKDSVGKKIYIEYWRDAASGGFIILYHFQLIKPQASFIFDAK